MIGIRVLCNPGSTTDISVEQGETLRYAGFGLEFMKDWVASRC